MNISLRSMVVVKVRILEVVLEVAESMCKFPPSVYYSSSLSVFSNLKQLYKSGKITLQCRVYV